MRFIQGNLAYRVYIGCNFNRFKHLFRDSSCHYPTCRFSCRTTTATAIIPYAIFFIICIICMTGAIGIFYMRIIFRFLIRVMNNKTNRSACGLSFKSTRVEFYRVWFFALRYNGRLARFSSV